MKVVELDEQSNTSITIFLLKNVEDIKSLRANILSGDLDCCAIKPSLIVNSFQLIVAANKAVVSKKIGKLTTKSLNTELLYNLSVSKNISQSLIKFGIDDSDKDVAIVIFSEEGENKFENLKNYFKGRICDIDEICELSDLNLIKKAYKITDYELEVSTLIDSVVSRIATKDLGTI